MSIQIGLLRIENPVVLAPMSGVTDLPFRRLVKRSGAGLVVSEMIASQALVRDSRKSLLMAATKPAKISTRRPHFCSEPRRVAGASPTNHCPGAAPFQTMFLCSAPEALH